MNQAWHSKPLEEAEKRNAFIGKTRWKIERAFELLERAQGCIRSRYLGRIKVEMKFHLHALVHNLKKAINLLLVRTTAPSIRQNGD